MSRFDNLSAGNEFLDAFKGKSIVLTHSYAIIQLQLDRVILVASGIVLFHKRGVVSADLGDVAELAVAKFHMAVARLSIGRHGACASAGHVR